MRGGVAPFAGAWIEICDYSTQGATGQSLPSRGRGLKYEPTNWNPVQEMSLPSRGRGLKSNILGLDK